MTTRSIRFSAIGCGILMLSAAGQAFAAEYRTVSEPIEGRYIVVLKPTAASLEGEIHASTARVPHVPSVATSIASQHGARLIRSYARVLRGFVVEADDKSLEKLLGDPRVDYVEEDGLARLYATQHKATWGLDRVDQRALPLNSTYIYDATGAGTHVYVIDSGIRANHSEFAGRVGNGFSAIPAGGTRDCNGHGTHVAGTLAGTKWGVAKEATVHPVRVLNCGNFGNLGDIIAGIDWVASNRIIPAVANLSLGGPASTSLDTAVKGLIASGVVTVVAAGNQKDNACNYSPARFPDAITVGSTASNDTRSWFSNWGPCLDIFAPGSSITSAWHTDNAASHTSEGTSMAAPHVAGAAALYLSIYPEATPAQVTNALLSNSTPDIVGSAGTGSPNRFLYTRISTEGGAPVITAFSCPDRSNSGLGTFMCRVAYSSSSRALASWRSEDGATWIGTVFSGTCTRSDVVNVTVTVTNSAGATSRNAQFPCPMMYPTP